MAKNTLTPKQESFCQFYIEEKSDASKAYRRAYEAQNSKSETVNREAKRLLDNPKIATRIEELQAAHRERHDVTVDGLTVELEKARLQAAKDDKGASAAVSAILGKAKLHGLLIDRSEVNANLSMTHEEALDRLK